MRAKEPPVLARLDFHQLVSELTGTGYSELEPGSITAMARQREPVALVCSFHSKLSIV